MGFNIFDDDIEGHQEFESKMKKFEEDYKIKQIEINLLKRLIKECYDIKAYNYLVEMLDKLEKS